MNVAPNHIDLSIPVEMLNRSFFAATFPPIGASTLWAAPPDEPDSPKSISLKIAPQRARTFSFKFPESTVTTTRSTRPISPSLLRSVSPSPAAKPATRIRPPGDIVKLEDRLYYLLQPPLESLLQSDALHFPFEPFSYQYQGVAFLYPRYSAILADEMGLGKTMQAITAVRMLLRSGELKSVLLICPKPLVTNWRREFNLWAPEIPLMIIEGDQAKRHWQWTQTEAPVKIANYELLTRDREALDADVSFDLVILDEAQRIKNSSSATN